MHTKNLVVKHAFEKLPATVLDTPLGKLVYQVMVRNANKPTRNRSK